MVPKSTSVMQPFGKHGEYLRLKTEVQRKLDRSFSKVFGLVQHYLGTEAEATTALVFGRRGEF